jgi:RNA-directed DNA polymerase
MGAVVERENLKKALAQVKRNKGVPGIDGMTVEDLGPYLKEHWLTIRAQLLEGTYKPQPVRQVLQANWDGTFCEMSFGFRPGRSAHQAVARAQAYIASGHAVVVDLDLEKKFSTGSTTIF